MRAGTAFAVVVTAVISVAVTSLFCNSLSIPTSATPVLPTTEATDMGRELTLPVVGIQQAQLVDTFTQSRAEGVRNHDAIDIMAPSGALVIAAAPGTVEKLFASEAGGNTIYVRSRDGAWVYYYAHLQNYAPGLHEGMQVTPGQPLGAVGSTGNADPSAPHLHFALHRMKPGERWYQGTPVNPYPLLKEP